MLAALITGERSLDLTEFPDPSPQPGQVVVDISYCGVCGTDLHAFQSGEPYNPTICGHEWVGFVSEAGTGVTALTEGDRVVVAVPPSCGNCDACRAGQPSGCPTVMLATLGRGPFATPHGGFAPRLAVDSSRVVGADPRLTDVQAALVEPATICFHAVRATQPRLGELAVVQGAGPIGLLTLMWVIAGGAATTVVVEPDPDRRRLAIELGAGAAVAPDEANDRVRSMSGGLGADVVYECAGLAATVQSAVDLARRRGRMSLIGLAVGEASISPATWLIKEITVAAALGYTHEEFQMAMGYIADGRIDVDALHTATIALDELGTRLAALTDRTATDVKVLVDPRR